MHARRVIRLVEPEVIVDPELHLMPWPIGPLVARLNRSRRSCGALGFSLLGGAVRYGRISRGGRER